MKHNGFTIIELIITIVILGVIGVFTFQSITRGLESYIMVSAAEDVAREARLALERMAREVRTATNIVSTSASSIVFNRTPPPASTDNSTQVTFRVGGGELKRDRVSPTGDNTSDTLASNVTGFTVTRNGDLITLDLTLTSGQATVRQRTRIYPRYFKYQ